MSETPHYTLSFSDAELRAIMVMCQGSIPNCVYVEVIAVCDRIREKLSVKGAHDWLGSAEKASKARRIP